MPSALDYSDSDDESTPQPSHVQSSTAGQAPDTSSPKTSGPRVKLTLRPSVSALMNDAAQSTEQYQPPSSSLEADLLDAVDASSPQPPASVPRPKPTRRETSLTPPPPITLRLAGRSAAVSRAASYSDSSDEDESAHPSKKPRLVPASHASSPERGVNPQAGAGAGAGAASAVAAAGGLSHLGGLHTPAKTYDWLPPSSVGTSHHGPPERAGQNQTPVPAGGATPSASGTPVLGAYVGEGSPALGSVDGDGKTKRPSSSATSKKKDAGPGKAWRKGLKKGMPLPWKEEVGSTFGSPGDVTPLSLEGSPEPGPGYDPSLQPPNAGDQTPFVEADAAKLGFPVFSKPIVPPKISLSTFPKVTQFFAPINGGDQGKFPRKERTRSWTHSERAIVGIGGGTLNFKSWTKAPGAQSELGRLIQADKEARSLARQRSKAAAAAASAASADASAVASANATAMAMANIPAWDRPNFPHGISSDSTATLSNMGGDGAAAVVSGAAAALVGVQDAGDAASDIGDGEESVVSNPREGMTPPPQPSTGASTPAVSVGASTPGGRRGAKAKPKPRKSKLAQEIHIESSTSAIEDIM